MIIKYSFFYLLIKDMSIGLTIKYKDRDIVINAEQTTTVRAIKKHI